MEEPKIDNFFFFSEMREAQACLNMERKNPENEQLWRQAGLQNSESQRKRGLDEAEAYSQNEVKSERADRREICISSLGHEAVLGEKMALWNFILSHTMEVSDQSGAWN